MPHSVVGTLELDRTFEERDVVNARVVGALNEVSSAWHPGSPVRSEEHRAAAEHAEMFDGAAQKSARFAELYPIFAAWYDLAFFDAGSVARASDLDGIHLEAAEHAKLGRALAAEVRHL